MNEKNVGFLLTPSYKCEKSHNEELTEDSGIFMLVMTLSAPKNLEARNTIRNSIKNWTISTLRSEGIRGVFG